MDISLTTLKSLISDVEIVEDSSEDAKMKIMLKKMSLYRAGFHSDTKNYRRKFDEIIDEEIQEQKSKPVGEIKPV